VGVITKKMSVQDWIELPDNPRQRDTVSHAKKAKKRHLAELSATHEVVSAAMVGGELVCKLDGHTRAFLWASGELRRPKKVTVHFYSCADMEEAKSLYSHFDNQSAVEGARDKITGACRENGIVLSSPMLKTYKFAVALQQASGFKGRKKGQEYRLVKLWKEELLEVDSWGLRDFHTAIKALALVLVANKREKVKEFFTLLDAGAGTREKADGYDGVMLLMMHLDDCKARGSTSGWDNIAAMFETAYTCYALFLKGKRLKRRVSRQTPRNVFCVAKKDLDDMTLACHEQKESFV